MLPQLRAHADMVDPVAFEWFLRYPARGLSFDIMLEAKAKDAALLRLREQLSARASGRAAMPSRRIERPSGFVWPACWARRPFSS